jgi:hypothetical protein
VFTNLNSSAGKFGVRAARNGPESGVGMMIPDEKQQI